MTLWHHVRLWCHFWVLLEKVASSSLANRNRSRPQQWLLLELSAVPILPPLKALWASKGGEKGMSARSWICRTEHRLGFLWGSNWSMCTFTVAALAIFWDHHNHCYECAHISATSQVRISAGACAHSHFAESPSDQTPRAEYPHPFLLLIALKYVFGSFQCNGCSWVFSLCMTTWIHSRAIRKLERILLILFIIIEDLQCKITKTKTLRKNPNTNSENNVCLRAIFKQSLTWAP